MMNHNYNWKFLLCKRGIYQIRQLSTGKLYIGSTANNFYDRMCAHNSVLKRGKHSSTHLQRAWDKYGKNDFVFEIVEELSDISSILQIELSYINKYQTTNKNRGFNIAKEVSPNRLGHHQSSETRKKISKTLTGIKRSIETRKKMGVTKRGTNSPMWGKKQSLDTITKRTKNLCKKIRRSDGKEFNSLKEAAAEMGCHYQSISDSLRNGRRCKGFLFYYVVGGDDE